MLTTSGKLDKSSGIYVGWLRENYPTWVAQFVHLTLAKRLTCGLDNLGKPVTVARSR
jgi:hypothetical protein